LATAISELQLKYHYRGEIKSLGIPDHFIEHGKPEELKALCGYDSQAILSCIQSFY